MLTDSETALSPCTQMKKCEKNIVESRRNSRIKTNEPVKQPELTTLPYLENNPNNSNNSSTSSLNGHARRKNLILKHEILSPECDLFKASTPRRLHFTLLARAAVIVLVGVVGSFYVLRKEFGEKFEEEWWWGVALVSLIGFLCFISVTVMLLQTIEGNDM